MKLTNSVYDKLKFITIIVLPALSTLYFMISSIWGLPYKSEVIGTIGAITLFFGSVLKISSANYNGDGKLQIDVPEDEEEPIKYIFDVEDPEALENNKFVTFKVDKK